MEAFEILQLVTAEAEQVDANFEFWLMGSFAVIVAVYAARNSLTMGYKHALATIYVFFCITTAIKFWADVDSISYYEGLLEGSGYTSMRLSNMFAGWSRIAVMLIGSIIAVTYIYLPKPSAGMKS